VSVSWNAALTVDGEKLASTGCNSLKQSVSRPSCRSAVDGKVLQVSPSLQPSLQIQDPLPLITVVDNSLQELASSFPHEDAQEIEGDRKELMRRSDGRLHHHRP